MEAGHIGSVRVVEVAKYLVEALVMPVGQSVSGQDAVGGRPHEFRRGRVLLKVVHQQFVQGHPPDVSDLVSFVSEGRPPRPLPLDQIVFGEVDASRQVRRETRTLVQPLVRLVRSLVVGKGRVDEIAVAGQLVHGKGIGLGFAKTVCHVKEQDEKKKQRMSYTNNFLFYSLSTIGKEEPSFSFLFRHAHATRSL